MASKVISYTDFRKGMNDTAPSDSLQDGELLLAENIDLLTGGGFSSRKGQEKFNAASLNGQVTQAFQWIYKNEERLMIVVRTGSDASVQHKLYQVDESGVATFKKDIAAARVGYFMIKDKLYIGDGTNMYMLEDNSITTLAATDGEARTKVRLIITSHAQYAGDAKVNIDGASTTVTLALDDTRSDVAAKIRAKTFTGWSVSGTGYEVVLEASTKGEKNVQWDPGTTGAWGEVIYEGRGTDADNIFNDFRKCTMFLLHVNSMRIFGAGNPDDPTALYYSEIGDPTFVKSTSVLYPATSEGKITGLLAIQQSVLVSYNYSWWQFTGTDPEGEAGMPDATWHKLPVPYGCVSHDTIALTPQSFTFMGKQGAYSVSTNLLAGNFIPIEGESLVKSLTGNKMERIMKSVKEEKIASAVYHDNRYFLAIHTDQKVFSDTTKPQHNNLVLVYDWRTEGFVIYTGWTVYDLVRHKGELMVASDNYVLATGKGNTDIDAETGLEKAIHYVAESKNYNLSSDINSKFVRLFHIMFRQFEEDESYTNIKLFADYKTSFFQDFKLTDALIYGRTWGHKWGWADSVQRQVEVMKIAHRFKVRIESDRLNDPVTIYGFGFEFKTLRSRSDRIDKEGLLDA